MNTSTCEASGLFKSYIDDVDYFMVYLPVYNNYKGKYKHLVDKLLVFNTSKLYSWVKNREELSAKNNNFLNSNALCYKVPVRYIEDCLSFQELIIEQIDLPESVLQNIKVPKQLYSLFADE